MVTPGQDRGPATSEHFPAGGRAALGGRRYGEVRMARDLAAEVETSACSESWYHQAAIDDAKPSRDH